MNKKILVIEDKAIVREIYQKELMKCGYDVTAVATGEEGLETFKKDKFDAVLLEVMLPGINGIEVLKKIKSDENNKSLAVVLLTNLGQEDVIKEGFDSGATGYLIKSNYNPDQIINEVKSFIEGPDVAP